jgi:hypothetical protein
MHTRIQELVDHLARERQVLADALAEVPPDRVTERPAADRWSAAEILEHLVIVERRIGGALAREVDAASAVGLAAESDDSPVASMLDVARYSSRAERVVASPQSQPTAGRPIDESWRDLQQARADLRATLAAASGLALATLDWPHPRLSALNGYQWMLFLGAHEARHADQIREVAAQLTNRPA